MSFVKIRGEMNSYKPSSIRLADGKKKATAFARTDRKNDQFRPMRFEFDIVPESTGSVYAEYGNTKIVIAIYGPKQSRNVSTFSNQGRFKCFLHYAPFAFAQRLTESRGKSIKEKDMATNIERALRNVILLEKYPKCTVEAHIWLLQCDGNELSCCINTSSLALVQAGIEMKDFITCCQIVVSDVGGDGEQNKNESHQKKMVLLDTTMSEQRTIRKQCEMVVSVMNATQQITLLNMNGSLSPKETKEALQLCFKGCLQLKQFMKTSLFKHYMSQTQR